MKWLMENPLCLMAIGLAIMFGGLIALAVHQDNLQKANNLKLREYCVTTGKCTYVEVPYAVTGGVTVVPNGTGGLTVIGN